MRLEELGQHSFRYRGLLLPVAIVILAIPSPHLVTDPAGIGVVGLLVALVGQSIRVGTIGLAYIVRGGKDHRVHAEDLVVDGIYAHVRNPMYLGNAFLLAGLALASNSWVFVLLGVPIAVLVHVTIVAAEEGFLRRKFGAGYDDYCRRVSRLLPRLAGLRSTVRSMRYDWRRVLRQEYAKPFDWIVAVALVVVVNLWSGGLVSDHRVLLSIMLAIVVARLALWIAASGLGQPDRPAGGGV